MDSIDSTILGDVGDKLYILKKQVISLILVKLKQIVLIFFRNTNAIFEAINVSYNNKNSIDEYIEYLSNAKFIESLEDENTRNKAFVKAIIKNYDVMLTDIEQVKSYLDNKISAEPYDWFGLPEVEKKLKQLAEAKYNQIGCEKALEKIDNMELIDIKRYLKELIKDDMTVGMAIIKGN